MDGREEFSVPLTLDHCWLLRMCHRSGTQHPNEPRTSKNPDGAFRAEVALSSAKVADPACRPIPVGLELVTPLLW